MKPRQLGTVLSPIGLDINAAEIRAVQLGRFRGDTAPIAHAIIPRLHGPGVARQIDEQESGWMVGVLRRKGFVGNRITVFAPHGSYSSQIVDLPDRNSEAPAEMIARAEIARNRRCAPDRFELATWYLPQRGRTERGMAVACERTSLDAMLDALESAGLEPVGVDLEETALACACRTELSAEPDAIHAIVRIGWNATVGVLTLGQTVVYTRRFEFGVAPFVQRVRDTAGLSWNDACRVVAPPGPLSALSDEPDPFVARGDQLWKALREQTAPAMDTAITYVSHAYRAAPVGRVFLAGFGADRPELIQGLDEALGMPVSPACSWEGHPSDIPPGQAARLAVAGALAARFDT